MDQVKPWYTSSAVWGGFLAVVVPVVAAAFKITISGEDVMKIADVCALFGGGVGGTLAIIGRIKANSKIG